MVRVVLDDVATCESLQDIVYREVFLGHFLRGVPGHSHPFFAPAPLNPRSNSDQFSDCGFKQGLPDAQSQS